MLQPPTDQESSTDDKVVPLRRQYLQIKARYPDTILFFRLGDFYETFERDAEITAQVLDIVLTSREMGKNLRVPLAGIPYHAADGYIAKLIAADYKVAVCEQIGEVTKGKGLVQRDVTRVITPGTVSEPSMLDAQSNNYIASVVIDKHRAGIAYADITTGEFRTTELTEDSTEEAQLAAGRELLRLNAAELVISAHLTDTLPLPQSAWLAESISLSRTDAWRWQTDRARDALIRHFRVDSLDGFGCSGLPVATSAAGGLLQYLEETQLAGFRQISSLSTYNIASFMTLDAQTRRNLELTESSRGDRKRSLVGILDRTRTPMGARLLRRWIGQPLLDPSEINHRLDGVTWFFEHGPVRQQTRDLLRTIGDIERLANRSIIGTIGPRELGTLRDALTIIPELVGLLTDAPGMHDVPDCSDLTALLTRSLNDELPALVTKGGVIRSGHASELDGHRIRAQEARDWIANLERSERNRTGIRTLKVGYNRVFGYYLEITAAALATAERDRATSGQLDPALPADYLPKQSLANATRYFTPQLKEYETLVLTAEETLSQLEHDAFHLIVQQIADNGNRLMQLASILAETDTLASLAEVAQQRNYVRPELGDSTRLNVVNGRHPVLEDALPPGEFVPNGTALDTEHQQIVILTGPNMAGKSSWLRQTALITLMAQIGSYVPADRAEIGIVDRIFTRIGAQDDIATGQSTFMVEMLETANILHHATHRSLIVLDEIGRGTSTYDGLAIARAIVEFIHNASRLGCKTLFATHYHELTELAEVLPRVQCFRMDVLEDGERIVFLRKIVPGGADKSYGIHVAQLAGIPDGIVRRAQDILRELEAQPSTKREFGTNGNSNGLNGLQLTFFDQPNLAIEKLKALDVESLSPLDALNTLYELRKSVS
ncbi:MAG: DNA mismatch repair protein MutS [Thermomicrobiales bacterium]